MASALNDTSTSELYADEDVQDGDDLYLVYFGMMAFNLMVTIPTALYYCYRILHPSNKRIFHKRYPHLTIATVLSFLIIHLVFKPLCDLPAYYFIPEDYDTKYLVCHHRQCMFAINGVYGGVLLSIRYSFCCALCSSIPISGIYRGH